MDGHPVTRRRRILLRIMAAVAVLGTAASCSGNGFPGTGSPTPTTTATPTAAGPVTAEISQFRDNYSKQIIEIQLTNSTGSALTVLGAELNSPLFSAVIAWPAHSGGIVLPPGQTKSLPAPLPAPECGSPAATTGPPGTNAASGGAPGTTAFVSLRLAQPPGGGPAGATTPAADPFGVLARNNAEMCLTGAASAVATIRLAPDLEVAADGRTAVVRLLVQPHATDAADAGGAELVIDRIDETTLLAEATQAPWPRSLTLRAGGPPQEVRLGIRPARCDPHAVAEDKVGTLLPLRVRVAGREGVLKVGADDQLRGRMYDFVTTACGRQ
ncbi:hypothetical protein AB4089_07570 [Arthrobacter sp. 2MCAF15]|uniref:hypothetical protein n=1 Tax=Arthrobacter sp. 2MCAF15 TaxID=3232984 RepID=UPI003F9309D1